MTRAETAPPGEARMRATIQALLELIASQPAASKMCFVEIYAAGPEAVEVIERTTDQVERFVLELFGQIPGREEMPPQMVRAMIGGLQKVIHKRLYRDEEEASGRALATDLGLVALLPAAAGIPAGPA